MTEAVLNTVSRPQFPCPGCEKSEPLHVLADRVIWACGHTRPLPPIGILHGPRPASRVKPRRTP